MPRKPTVRPGPGRSFTRTRPICEVEFASFFYCAFDQVCNQAAKLRYMSGGQARMPITFRCVYGAMGGAAAQHSETVYAQFLSVAGIKLVVPSNPSDMKGLLKSAIRDDNPVIVFEHGALGGHREEIPTGEHLVPLGKAAIKRVGENVTVVAIGAMVPRALKVADRLAKENISVEVVDPRTLIPLDEDTILSSVEKTNRAVVFDEGHLRGGAAALMLTAAACGTAAANPAPAPTRLSDQTAAFVALARTELQLTLSWAPSFLDVAEELRRQSEGFNRLYGLKIGVNFKAAQSMRDATTRAIQEFQGGMKASTDIVIGTEAEISELAKAGALLSESWLEWAPNINGPRQIAAGGVAVQVQTRMPGITYNSAKLTGASIPRSLADLLKPQYKGRIATTQTTALFERLALANVWGADRTIAYVRQLAGQVSGFIDCGEEDRVATGEFDIFVYDCGSARTFQMKARGTLIGWSAPTDGAMLGYLYMGIPKNAVHPNAAKLWINYMLSREAQDVMYEYGFADHHLITGSRSFTEVDRATKAGVKFFELNVEVVQVDAAKGVKPVGPLLQSILREAVASKR